jgi:NADP-dependent 3-hydroxy acid dehydrogenase YdfG
MTGVEAFAGQVALVTGASGGIGGAIATVLAHGGARVCLAGRSQARLAALADRMRQNSGVAVTYAVDLTDDVQITTLVEQIAAVHGRLDILVHCAGTIEHGSVERAPVTLFDLQYAANVRGPYLLTQGLLPLLKKRRGQVVFVNSSRGLMAAANAGQFSATQHALRAVADALRDEVNGDNIRVLSVFPGRTATPRIEALHVSEGRPYQPELLLQPDDIASVVVNALALPWTAEVTNISIRPMLKSY